MDQNVNGTTLTMSRKGSGLNDIVNPCIDEYMRTEEYYKLCKEFDSGHMLSDCFENEFFKKDQDVHRVLAAGGGRPANYHWFTPTKDLKT